MQRISVLANLFSPRPLPPSSPSLGIRLKLLRILNDRRCGQAAQPNDDDDDDDAHPKTNSKSNSKSEVQTDNKDEQKEKEDKKEDDKEEKEKKMPKTSCHLIRAEFIVSINKYQRAERQLLCLRPQRSYTLAKRSTIIL
ncbi:hypothetical protein ACLKA7_017208 [Drosophila subpalustris]